MNKIGNYIRSIRVGKNLTAEYMAANLGLAQSSYSAYETGRAKLVHPNFFKIAAHLEIDPLELFKKGFLDQNNDYTYFPMVNQVNEAKFSEEIYQLKGEIEQKTKLIGVLEYRLSKYEPVKENKTA